MSSAVPDKRDVKEPLLFECAWEVANKGSYSVASLSLQQTAQLQLILHYSIMHTIFISRWHIHGYQDQGAGHSL